MFVERLENGDIKEYLMGLTYFKENDVEVKVDRLRENGVYQITIRENGELDSIAIAFEDTIIFEPYYMKIPAEYGIEKNSWQVFMVKKFGKTYIKWYVEEMQREHEKLIKSLNEEHARKMKVIMRNFELAKNQN